MGPDTASSRHEVIYILHGNPRRLPSALQHVVTFIDRSIKLNTDSCNDANFVITGDTKVVVMTTSCATSEDSVGIMTSLGFHRSEKRESTPRVKSSLIDWAHLKLAFEHGERTTLYMQQLVIMNCEINVWISIIVNTRSLQTLWMYSCKSLPQHKNGQEKQSVSNPPFLLRVFICMPWQQLFRSVEFAETVLRRCLYTFQYEDRR